MANINLLPTDLGPDKAVADMSVKIKRTATLLAAFLVVLITLAVGSVVLITNRAKESIQTQQELKASIKALEATEQKLILIKDRVDKSSQVFAADNATEHVEELEGLFDSLPPGVTIDRSEIFPGKSEVVFSAESSVLVVDLFEILKSSGKFRFVELLSLDYSQSEGYKIAFVLIN